MCLYGLRVRQFDIEQLGELRILEHSAAFGSLRWQRQACRGARDQIVRVDPARREEQLRLIVQTSSDAVECRRDVLAHRSPIRAAAIELDFLGRGEGPRIRRADALHHVLGEAPLQQLDQGIDRGRALLAE